MAGLVGSPGLALDLVHWLLHRAGFVVVDVGDDPDVAPGVLVLVEPGSEQLGAAREHPAPVILVLGRDVDDSKVVNAVLAGADAVVSYDSSPGEILEAYRSVSQGGSVLSPSQVRAVAELARSVAVRPSVVLTAREGQILAGIADGQSVKQTARALGISPKTVENLQGRLYRKLDATNRAQAIARGHAHGVLRPDPTRPDP